MKKRYLVLIMLMAFFTGIILCGYIKSVNDKLPILRQDIIGNYYDEDKLKQLFKDTLGENYTGNISEDFDNYVIKKVMNDLSSFEDDKYKVYNDFMSKDRLKKYLETREENANKLYGEKINDSTYYINLTQFRDGITYKNFMKHDSFLKNYRNLIIDLRNNSGGNYEDLTKILDLFVDKGKILYKMKYSNKEEIIYSKSEKQYEFDKIVILVNDRTASVSELFILSLKGNLDNVITIGCRTYGKGISYAIRTFRDDSGMIFINSIMKGPNSEEIDINGIVPDIEVGNTEDYYSKIEDEKVRNEERERDSKLQLNKAVEYLQ